MAVRGEQRLLDRQADHFLARSHDAGGAAPLVEQHARTLDVAGLHRELDVGEVVAELPEAEREIEHGDVEDQREQRVHRVEHRVQREGEQHRRQHGDQPGDHAVAALAAVEGLLEPRRPRRERALHGLALAQRAPLLDDQRGDDRENTHDPFYNRCA